MAIDQTILHRICYLPVELNQRGNLSVVELLHELDYPKIKTSLTKDGLLPLIQKDNKIIGYWLAWSEDQRTAEGWVFQRGVQQDWTVWYFSPQSMKAPTPTYDNASEACADYILPELNSIKL